MAKILLAEVDRDLSESLKDWIVKEHHANDNVGNSAHSWKQARYPRQNRFRGKDFLYRDCPSRRLQDSCLNNIGVGFAMDETRSKMAILLLNQWNQGV
jgi:hypothetical protein